MDIERTRAAVAEQRHAMVWDSRRGGLCVHACSCIAQCMCVRVEADELKLERSRLRCSHGD